MTCTAAATAAVVVHGSLTGVNMLFFSALFLLLFLAFLSVSHQCECVCVLYLPVMRKEMEIEYYVIALLTLLVTFLRYWLRYCVIDITTLFTLLHCLCSV
jgi:hypothetical protein